MTSEVHRIRLRDPWEVSVGESAEWSRTDLDSAWARFGGRPAGRVRFRRRFSRPSGLEPGDEVRLVIEAPVVSGTVVLNGNVLGVVEPSEFPAEFAVGDRLQDGNLLEVDVVTAETDASDLPAGPWKLVVLEIRPAP